MPISQIWNAITGNRSITPSPHLISLNNQLNNVSSNINTINNNINQLNRRLNDLNSLRTAFRNNVNNNTSTINNRLNTASTSIGNAIRYSGREGNLRSRLIPDGREHAIGSDSNLTSADADIGREISHVQSQISQARSDLDSARQLQNDLNSQIRAEEQRLRQEQQNR